MAEKLEHQAEHHDQEPGVQEQLHQQFEKDHPGALRALNAAVEAGSDYRQVPWLDPGASPEAGRQETGQIADALEKFCQGRDQGEQLEARRAVAGLMEMPLQRALEGLPEPEPHERVGEPLAHPHTILCQTAWNHSSRLVMANGNDENWQNGIQGLRNAAADLEKALSGQTEADHFTQALTGLDPELSEELHAAEYGQEHVHVHGRWPRWVTYPKRAEAVFDTFQEAVGGMSEAYRQEAACEVAMAMAAHLYETVARTGSARAANSHQGTEEGLIEALMDGDRQKFDRNVGAMGHTSRLIDRYEQYGTESPTAAQIESFRAERATPEGREEVFCRYLEEHDPGLAQEVRQNGWPEFTQEQQQAVYDTFVQNSFRLNQDGSGAKAARELAENISDIGYPETGGTPLERAEARQAERDREAAERTIRRGLVRADPQTYRNGIEMLATARDRLKPA